jgi:hypothetical protein
MSIDNHYRTIFIDGIRALQCRDCCNVCHEKCRSSASCKPCRRIGMTPGNTADTQVVVNSTRFETGSVTGNYCPLTEVVFPFIDNVADITDDLLEKAGKHLLETS